MNIGRIIKYGVEKASVRLGVTAISRRALRGRTLVLAYHNIVPHGRQRVGDRSLHLPQREFTRQLDELRRTHEVIGLDQAFDNTGATGRPRVAITFDDAYHGALTAGVEELVRRNISATFFAVPGLLGETMWWDLIADEQAGVVLPKYRHHALETLAGDRNRIIDWAATLGLLDGSRDADRLGTEAELIEAAQQPGISIGSHTWSHANLCALDDTALSEQLLRPATWLETRLGTRPQAIAYPYGLYSTAVQSAAASVGYRAAFRVDGGWIPATTSLPCTDIPRYNVPAGLSLDGFRMRLANLLT